MTDLLGLQQFGWPLRFCVMSLQKRVFPVLEDAAKSKLYRELHQQEHFPEAQTAQ